jgi:hypothetical protein
MPIEEIEDADGSLEAPSPNRHGLCHSHVHLIQAIVILCARSDQIRRGSGRGQRAIEAWREEARRLVGEDLWSRAVLPGRAEMRMTATSSKRERMNPRISFLVWPERMPTSRCRCGRDWGFWEADSLRSSA